jgi:hypothetical protein
MDWHASLNTANAAALGRTVAAKAADPSGRHHPSCQQGLQPTQTQWAHADARAPRTRDALRLGTALDRALSEKGVLQLLLDVRFLRNALAGGRPTPADAAPPGGPAPPAQGDGAALAQRKRAFADLRRPCRRGRGSGCSGSGLSAG